jgi:hypothetical protein
VKGGGRDLIITLPPTFAWAKWRKPRKISVMLPCVRTEIRTKYLRSTSLRRYRYTNLLRCLLIYPEDMGNKFFRNIGTYLPNYTVLDPSLWPTLKPQYFIFAWYPVVFRKEMNCWSYSWSQFTAPDQCPTWGSRNNSVSSFTPAMNLFL